MLKNNILKLFKQKPINKISSCMFLSLTSYSIYSYVTNDYYLKSLFKKIEYFNLTNYFSKNTIECFKSEDKEIRRVRDIVNDKIKELEFKYEGNLRRQNIDFGIRGGKYYAEFTINKANVNPDQLLNEVLKFQTKNSGNNNKNEGKSVSRQSFKIIDQTKLQEEDIYTLKLEYEVESNTVEYGKNKGVVYIRGTFGKVYDNFLVCIEKQNDFCDCDINILMNTYESAFKPQSAGNFKKTQGKNESKNPFSGMFNSDKSNSSDDPIATLQKHGVIVFEPNSKKNLDWGYLAGYENQKRMIEDSILLGLTHGEIYDEITKNTRVKFETNRPKAILFEGPPGCGKTTSAKIIANQVNIPLIYMPLESIMSKWYGESENKFSDIFEAAKALGKSIIFIDEIDALATSREDGIHEATRRILSTLLRKIDGFESEGEVLLICATNRRKDLDPALLSRLDVTVTFDLPDKRMRSLIFQKYAKHLSQTELENLAEIADNFSGRDITDVCKDTERKWASMYIRKEKKNIVPDVNTYIESINQRAKYMGTKH
jgi:ATP-dependent 26S proteasome regulatory subunit